MKRFLVLVAAVALLLQSAAVSQAQWPSGLSSRKTEGSQFSYYVFKNGTVADSLSGGGNYYISPCFPIFGASEVTVSFSGQPRTAGATPPADVADSASYFTYTNYDTTQGSISATLAAYNATPITGRGVLAFGVTGSSVLVGANRIMHMSPLPIGGLHPVIPHEWARVILLSKRGPGGSNYMADQSIHKIKIVVAVRHDDGTEGPLQMYRKLPSP